MFDDLIDLLSLADEFKAIKGPSKSTLYKLASGNYPDSGQWKDFPVPVKIGHGTYWKRSEIKAWVENCIAISQAKFIAAQEMRKEKKPDRTETSGGHELQHRRRGRPSSAELHARELSTGGSA